ncbi:patatin-like phospholipase family protein [Dinoroseobacter sp. PD6]|uniref:patatin-like phospholipase family protein n=1 Tax=Dinoroseobacter sp. PD6 TaxID=3028384 RepID=UPI00237BF017|nr:patatin-like phospholipase family protein [Dinoroseobacter sp. PD6]MDD9715624.1 patatin-like phospholipase family protein [Dinoroseobacter sp. PD6]
MARKKRINLALQGGGAHGAFTWGVLDRLLAEPEIEIAGISGTSAGTLNGAAVKAALAKGGTAEDARENLDWLWGQIAGIHDTRFAPWLEVFPPSVIATALEYSPYLAMAETLEQFISPYDTPFSAQNPLARIVERFNYDNICCDSGPKFHVCATNVRTGKLRVFTGTEIGAAPILASACLPTLFRAVEIFDPETGRDESYWDGGYSANPALEPLTQDPDLPGDVVIVHINPLHREEIPTSAKEIANRVNEISFNSSLIQELSHINAVNEMLADGRLVKGTMKDVFIHMIADDGLMVKLSEATKVYPNPAVIASLKAAGEDAAEDFLARDLSSVNVKPTVDLARLVC